MQSHEQAISIQHHLKERNDCDGVGDVCDQCPGGNDNQDKDYDGIPDCMDQGSIQDLPEEWICDKNYKKVLLCHRSPDHPDRFETLCVNFSAVAEHLANGDYLGPCAVTTCSNNANSWTSPLTTVKNITNVVTIYPNPNHTRLLNLSFNAPVENEGHLYILDIYGKTLQDMPIGIGQRNLSMPLAFATPGIYIISVQIGDRMAHKQKVVVN